MCRLVRLPPGFVGTPIRHTASSVWFVVRGAGRAEIDGTPLDWSWRDSFVIPNWSRHALSNRSATQDALLFTVSDQPALAALGLYREMR
jgi:gentisate 1,2-dioxygenase